MIIMFIAFILLSMLELIYIFNLLDRIHENDNYMNAQKIKNDTLLNENKILLEENRNLIAVIKVCDEEIKELRKRVK